MTILIQALFLGFFGGIAAGTWATWRLDWILLHEHPDLHREWQLGQLWSRWWSSSIYGRLNALGDVRITRLLRQANAAAIFCIAIFGLLAIIGLVQRLIGG